MVERTLAATIFQIQGIDDVRFRFHVLRIKEKVPKDGKYEINMQRWADLLWRRYLKCPVFTTSKYDFSGFIIPEGAWGDRKSDVELPGIAGLTFHVEPTEIISEIILENSTIFEKELLCRMIERPISEKFLSLKEIFWRSDWTLYFKLIPENLNNTADFVNAYRGMKYGVIIKDDKHFFLAGDIRTRYVGKKPFSQYSEDEKKGLLSRHISDRISFRDKASFLRDNDSVKIPCKYAGEAGRSADDYIISDLSTTISDYYKKRYNICLPPNDPVVFVQDRTNMENTYPVPSSRMFPIFTIDYDEMSTCSVKSQITPSERYSMLQEYLEHISILEVGDIRINISNKVYKTERTILLPPKLEFGNGKILDPHYGGTRLDASSLTFDREVNQWTSQKLPFLKRYQPQHNEVIPDIVLMYPENLTRETREAFIEGLKRGINLISNQSINIKRQIKYKTGRDETMGSSLLKEAAALNNSDEIIMAVVVLWNQFDRRIHAELKRTLKSKPSQCAMERTVFNIATKRNPNQAESQVTNLSIGVLTAVGAKPWVIADGLSHDLFIGIDVLDGDVGYHFLYGKGARYVRREMDETIDRGRKRESIKSRVLQSKIESIIEDICLNSGETISKISVHRDGRWWNDEKKGFNNAMNNLVGKGILPRNLAYNVVEIRKNHIPLRIFTVDNENNNEFQRNPLHGTYLKIDNGRLILNTTGNPGKWDRRGMTAGTILLNVVESNADYDICDIAKDVYYLTHLNWSSPNIEIAHPVTIRWTDEALRETYRPPSNDEDIHDEGDIFENEEDDDDDN